MLGVHGEAGRTAPQGSSLQPKPGEPEGWTSVQPGPGREEWTRLKASRQETRDTWGKGTSNVGVRNCQNGRVGGYAWVFSRYLEPSPACGGAVVFTMWWDTERRRVQPPDASPCATVTEKKHVCFFIWVPSSVCEVTGLYIDVCILFGRYNSISTL